MSNTQTSIMLLAFFAAAGLTSCAGSAATESISRTETMPGSAGSEAAEAQPDTATRAVDYSTMFAGVANTAAYNLATLAKMDPNLSTFAVMMEQADLHHALKKEGTFTLFAPSNQAFAHWPQDSVNTLMKPEYKAQLIRLLQAHMLLKEASAPGLGNSQSIETSGGEHIAVSTDHDTIAVGGATIVRPGVRASNGILHVVDRVVTPVESQLERY